jgi:hypothetical protein
VAHAFALEIPLRWSESSMDTAIPGGRGRRAP